VSKFASQLGKLALITALFALLPAAGATTAAPSPLSGPFSFDAAVPRHGPERIADAAPPRTVVGEPYSHQFDGSGQVDPVFSADATDLPDGLSLDEDGRLSGVPTRAGHYFFVVFAVGTGSEGTEQQVNMDVVAPPQLSLEAANPFAATEAGLAGRVDPGNLAVDAWFEYWSASDPTPLRTPVETFGAAVKSFKVEANITGLVPAVDYSFRLAATSDLGPDPVYSETGSLRTALPPPKAGQSFNIEPVGGSVSTKCANEDGFTKLNRPKQVTLDCQIDAENGTVSVTASKGSSGQTQTAEFWGGMFDIDQEAGDNAEAVVTLAGQRRCEKRTGKVRRAPLRSRKGKGGRKLWGSGSGNYKTVGGHGAATVRGTIWLVADRCNGSTFFKVKKGTVVVRDFVKKATVVLQAGESYIARASVAHLP
jgi:hypothetical protein